MPKEFLSTYISIYLFELFGIYTWQIIKIYWQFLAAEKENKCYHFQVHLLESHTEEFLKMKAEKYGLGFYSEQAMESMHKELKKEYGVDKVDVKHPNYGSRLLKTVIRINGKHI